ncbi:PQ-loop repeat-containing protein [Candidatus Babeliales bacterium]|nr:PQ-loop repeat-containing protein [Candidatus Babeliales bacterium]
MISAETFFDITTWAIKILFWAGLLPQLLLNRRQHSTRGMSGLMLWGYFNGYLMATFYVFCLNLPIAYKFMVPVSLLTVSVMVAQRFIYDKDFGQLWYYAGSLIIGFIGIPLAFSNAALVGNLFGWASVFIWAFYQLPQIFKIYFEKRVVGFSFLLVSAIGIANLTETGIAVWFGFPTQSVLSGLRGGLIYAVFCTQFMLYRKNGYN